MSKRYSNNKQSAKASKQLKYLQYKLNHFGERPDKVKIDTLIIHSMYAKGFGARQFDPKLCLRILEREGVSAHYSISRSGRVFQSVAEDKRAWHAGVSKLPFRDDERVNINDFSIGIELIASTKSGFSSRQYLSLAALSKEICSRHKIKIILGHQHISPGRKSDPGNNFDWQHYLTLIDWQGRCCLELTD
jgi:N-acetyl-anhydromuramyl-L-alanine amidase AmpD